MGKENKEKCVHNNRNEYKKTNSQTIIRKKLFTSGALQ